jgi:predicted metalloprotease
MTGHLIAQLAIVVWVLVTGGLAVAVNWLLRYRVRSVRIVGAVGLPVAIFLVTLIASVPGRPQVQAPPSARSIGIPQDDLGRFLSAVLGSTELQWKQIFAQGGRNYRPPILVLYRGATRADCGGVAQSAMGPFYCPVDQKVYLDDSFFDQIATRLRGCDVGSKYCQFALAYGIAHEVGHHVQNLLGILPKARQAQSTAGSLAVANHIQVQVELQADCLAGVWANHENQWVRSQGKPPLIEAGDVEAALRTAAAIGDDFTHGSAEQRQRWFMTGLQSGKVGSCNTFAAGQL